MKRKGDENEGRSWKGLLNCWITGPTQKIIINPGNLPVNRVRCKGLLVPVGKKEEEEEAVARNVVVKEEEKDDGVVVDEISNPFYEKQVNNDNNDNNNNNNNNELRDTEEAIIWASSVGKAVDYGMPTNEGTKGRFISVLRPRH
ncbi:hypothetical protein M0804_008844 [Polistes exclamans]|nr:hypothetical protein M0804_008844 [Polistes exclamans]